MSDEQATPGAPYERQWAGSSRARLLLALTHPRAVAIFAGMTLLLAALIGGQDFHLADGLLLALAMAAAQAAIGIFNEVFDADLDARAKPWRTLPAGLISRRSAALWASALACAALGIAAWLSLASMLLLSLGLASGIVYSARLKRSALSWLPYAVSYPLPPVWIAVSLGAYRPRMLTIYPVALPFIVGIHLANQLRDFDEDAAMGMRGLAHVLGKQAAAALCFACLALGPLLLVAVGGLRGAAWQAAFIVGSIAFHWLRVLPPIARYARTPDTNLFRVIFARLQLSAPLMYFAWLLIIVGK